MTPDPNPAVEPEPEQPSPVEYEVTGPQVVLDHAPGETFKATLDSDHEARLIAAGHIRRTDKPRPKGTS